MQHILSARRDEQEENHWISVSDLMAGLMMVFLFISITLMHTAYVERDKIKQIAIAYQVNQLSIYHALDDEFRNSLTLWDADIDQDTLTFTFKSPDMLFYTGEIAINQTYQKWLDDFFPRYMRALEPFKDSINEIRIEGHTSSDWAPDSSIRDAYFNNMELSQGRTRSVLDYVYNLESSAPYRLWMQTHIAAVGLSSSKPVFDVYNREDHVKSRRVSFRVLTDSDIQIRHILDDK